MDDLISKLDEAIVHAEEVSDYDAYGEKQRKCAEEHRQLAEWLKDYKRLLKEQKPIKPKKSPLSMNNGFMWDIYDCGFCGNQLRSFAKFCDQCGKAVEHEW